MSRCNHSNFQSLKLRVAIKSGCGGFFGGFKCILYEMFLIASTSHNLCVWYSTVSSRFIAFQILRPLVIFWEWAGESELNFVSCVQNVQFLFYSRESYTIGKGFLITVSAVIVFFPFFSRVVAKPGTLKFNYKRTTSDRHVLFAR